MDDASILNYPWRNSFAPLPPALQIFENITVIVVKHIVWAVSKPCSREKSWSKPSVCGTTEGHEGGMVPQAISGPGKKKIYYGVFDNVHVQVALRKNRGLLQLLFNSAMNPC